MYMLLIRALETMIFCTPKYHMHALMCDITIATQAVGTLNLHMAETHAICLPFVLSKIETQCRPNHNRSQVVILTFDDPL